MSPAQGPLLRELLAARGGVAGAVVLAEDLTASLGRSVSPRRVRDIARSAPGRVVDLGASYLALTEDAPEPVLSFATTFVVRGGGMVPAAELVAAVLSTYPYGAERSVRAWLSQEPGRLQLEGRSGSRRVRWLGPPRV